MYSSRTIFQVIFVSLYLVTIIQFSTARRNKCPVVPFRKLATCKEFDIESKSCEHFFPIENIKNVKTNDYKLHLKFYVLTTNDANIVLSNMKSINNVRYTIIIGGFNNTYSWIRNTQEKTVGLDSHLTDILSPLWVTPIVVRQKHSGELEVAIPDVVDPLLKVNAADLDVHSVCLFAWQAESRWFYNCAEEDVRYITVYSKTSQYDSEYFSAKSVAHSLYLVCNGCRIAQPLESARRNKYPVVPFGKLATCKEFNIESESCQHYFPIENIKNLESNDYKLYLKFYVMTSNDANIVLSNKSPNTNRRRVKYTIVVGGNSNTYSWIRNRKGKTVGRDNHLSNLLSPLWPTQIVVRQKHSGELEVAIPHVVDPLLKADAADLDVHSVCLYAWKAESRWFFKCAEEDVNDPLSTIGPDIQNNTSV